MKLALPAFILAALLAAADYWVLMQLGATENPQAMSVLLGGPFVFAAIVAALGARIAPVVEATPVVAAEAAPAVPVAPALPPETAALQLLATLQEEGRLVDFLTEDIGPYSDEQVGAATRSIHETTGKALRACMGLEPVLAGKEDEAVTVPAGFDPAAIRLTGNVHGEPPFTGTLRHPGWRVTAVTLPARAGLDPRVIAPAEVEIA